MEGCEEKEEKNEEFDYESLWNKEFQKKEKKLVEELPRGAPRKGLKGKYIKKRGHVGRVQLKRSYGSYFKTSEGTDIIKD
ncbi:Uncharacterised protein [uncultured archaeon]|nr:Uncharacterised protein [uncultured archaeon]